MKVKDIKAIERFISTINEQRIAKGYFELNETEIVLMNEYSIIIFNNINNTDKSQITNNIEKSKGQINIDKIIKDFNYYNYNEDTKEIISMSDLETLVKQVKRENKLGRELCVASAVLKYDDLIYKNNGVWANKELLMIVGNCLGGKQIEIITTNDKLKPIIITGKYGIAYVMPINHE